MVKSPCKNCADRALGCHGYCKEYLAFAQERRAEVNWERDHKPPLIGKKSFTGTSPAPGKHRRTKRMR